MTSQGKEGSIQNSITGILCYDETVLVFFYLT
jgi:hypothetical protein